MAECMYTTVTRRVVSIDHVQLPMPFRAGARAREFYQQYLGLEEVRDPWLDRPGTLRFAVGADRIDLCEGIYQPAASQAHLALVVNDLAPLVQRLFEAGYSVDAQRLDQGHVYVDDPFGNCIELIDPQLEERPNAHGSADRYLVAV